MGLKVKAAEDWTMEGDELVDWSHWTERVSDGSLNIGDSEETVEPGVEEIM